MREQPGQAQGPPLCSPCVRRHEHQENNIAMCPPARGLAKAQHTPDAPRNDTSLKLTRSHPPGLSSTWCDLEAAVPTRLDGAPRAGREPRGQVPPRNTPELELQGSPHSRSIRKGQVLVLSPVVTRVHDSLGQEEAPLPWLAWFSG